MPELINNRPASVMVMAGGRMRSSIHTATPSSNTPKTPLTASIQEPARGSSLPAEVPITISGTPMPMLKANSAMPPSIASPVWLM